MNTENKARIQKYALRISILFFVFTGSHIFYNYIYDDALESPKKWGIVTEAIIGPFAHLNPLIASNDYNKNIINFLYRSLLRYDDTTGEIVGDLADCDLSDLSRIQCVLKNNIFWSDGTSITIDDVRDTYNIIEKSDLNVTLSNILKSTTIEVDTGEITFLHSEKNIDLIQILFTPIVNSRVLNSKHDLSTNFYADDVYSGPYMLDPKESFVTASQNEQGIEKIILLKNPHYKEKEILIERYVYLFFTSREHLKQHQNLVNILFDKTHIIGDTSSRFTVYPYYFHQFNTLFLNQERLKNADLRHFILSRINTDSILLALGKDYKKIENLFGFPNVVSNFSPTQKELGEIMNASGYYKVPQLASILQENSQQETLEAKPLSHIVSPMQEDQYFTGENNILLTGNVGDKSPDAIYVNDYKLSGYKKWDRQFNYRIRTDWQTLHPGNNVFYIHFETNGEKELVETFTITYSSRPEKLKELEEQYQKQVEESKLIPKNQEELLDRLSTLDENTYYNKNLEKFMLRMYYSSSRDTDIAAKMIQEMLEVYGIWVELSPFSIQELTDIITKKDGKNYDILFTGIDTRQFSIHWYAYFHSSQTKEKFHNYAQIQDNTIDTLLEEAKENMLSQQRAWEIAQGLQNVLDEKHVLLPLYKKQHILLIDKKIKDFSFPSDIAQETAFISSITNAYVSSERTIDFSRKNIFDFLKFVKKVFARNE